MEFGLIGLGSMLLMMVIGLMVGGLIYRGSVTIVKSLFKIDQQMQASAGWSTQQSYGQGSPTYGQANPMMPGAQYQHPSNPYSVGQGSPIMQPAYQPQFETLPVPSFGKSVLIILLTMISSFIIGLISRLFLSVVGFDSALAILVQTFAYLVNATVFVVTSKYLLPTSFIWSLAVLVAYTILCFLIVAVIGIVIAVPLLLFGGVS